MTENQFKDLLEKVVRKSAAKDLAWHQDDARGRWFVLERGPGHLLDAPKRVRDYVDARFPGRARRFSSLSRARAFAREMGGVLRRCRRYMRKPMTNPWERVRWSVG